MGVCQAAPTWTRPAEAKFEDARVSLDWKRNPRLLGKHRERDPALVDKDPETLEPLSKVSEADPAFVVKETLLTWAFVKSTWAAPAFNVKLAEVRVTPPKLKLASPALTLTDRRIGWSVGRAIVQFSLPRSVHHRLGDDLTVR